MSATRQLDLRGSVNGRDAAGRSLEVRCDGSRITLEANSTRAALAALSAFQSARATGSLAALSPLIRFAMSQISDFRVELRVRGRTVGRGGRGAHPNWLGQRLTQMPIEVHWTALAVAVLTGF